MVHLTRACSYLAAVDEGSYRPNCRTHLGLDLRELSIPFFGWHCNTTSHSTTRIPLIGKGGGIQLLHYTMICVISLAIFIINGRGKNRSPL